MKHAINWFEIPVKNFEGSKAFYEAVFQTTMETMEYMGNHCAFFPSDMQDGAIGGCIKQGEGSEPSQAGSLIYLNGGDDLANPLSRVESAGGKITLPKTDISPNGFMAHFIDLDGNKVALHSRN